MEISKGKWKDDVENRRMSVYTKVIELDYSKQHLSNIEKKVGLIYTSWIYHHLI